MDFFKRNIILLATFSIVISYMIITANADSDICKHELSHDQFNTETEYDKTYVEHLKKPITDFTKPHSKVYHKIINYYKAFMSPMIFCLWIYTNDNQYYSKIMMNNDLDLTEVWRSSLQELHTYIYINVCVEEISNDTYNNVKKEIVSCNHEIKLPSSYSEKFSTPYGKAYHKTSKFYSDMYSTLFCSWINMDVNTDYSQIIWKINNADPSEIWRSLVQDIFICTENIGKYFNLQDHLCFAELKRDGFNTNLEYENTETGQNLTLVARGKENAATPHGKAYIEMLIKDKVNILSMDFCLRIYGVNQDRSKDWYNLKKEIIYNTCLDLINYNGFNITNQRAGINKKHITQKFIKNLRTSFGEEYGNFLRESGRSDIRDNSNTFCINHSANYVSLLKKYYNEDN